MVGSSQLVIRNVDTKAVITVRMKLPILSAGIFLKIFIKLNLEIIYTIELTPRGMGARSPHERSSDAQVAFMIVF